jgi:hypothetical protein
MPAPRSKPPKSPSLKDLASRAPRRALKTADVPVGDLFGNAADDVVLSYQEADAPTFWRIADDAAEIRRRNPDLTESLAMQVATLAACHKAPIAPGDAPAQFYLDLLQPDSEGHVSDAFIAIYQRVMAAFLSDEASALFAPEQSLADAKNG